MTAPAWLRSTGRTINSNSTTILSATAVAGVIATAVLAARATRRIEIVIQSDRTEALPTELYHTGLDKKRIKAHVQYFWRDYIPPVVSGMATIACIIGANQIGLRRQAALLGAYTLADTAFREYKDEVIKQIGVNKETKVHDEIAKRHIDENPVRDDQVIITGGGEQMCYDVLSGRYFKSDIETIRQAANNINQQIVGGDMYASLNEFWAFLGLGPTTLGEEMGFNLEHFVELVFTSHLAQDGKACLAVGYSKLPIADYGKVY